LSVGNVAKAGMGDLTAKFGSVAKNTDLTFALIAKIFHAVKFLKTCQHQSRGGKSIRDWERTSGCNKRLRRQRRDMRIIPKSIIKFGQTNIHLNEQKLESDILNR